MITLCHVTDITDGTSKGFLPDSRGRDRIFLVKRGPLLVGYYNLCPHYGSTRLGWKKDEFLNGDATRIVCASHGALFRIDDGYCELGPCLGQSLKPAPIVVNNGIVQLSDEILCASMISSHWQATEQQPKQ